jgi:hypothetical protein
MEMGLRESKKKREIKQDDTYRGKLHIMKLLVCLFSAE